MVLRSKKSMSSIESESEFDVLAKKVVNPKNVQAFDMAESLVLQLPNHSKDDLNLSGESLVKDSDIISAIKDMNKSFYAQLSKNYAQLSENNAQLIKIMNAMGRDMSQSLDRCVVQLNENMTAMQGNISEIRANVIELKAENMDIKRDLEASAFGSQKKMIYLKKSVMRCINDVSYRVVRVESAVANMPGLISDVSRNVRNNSLDLNGISTKDIKPSSLETPVIDDADKTVLQSVVLSSDTSSSEPVVSSSLLGNASTGDAIAKALAQQTRFNTAMALGCNPLMFFFGELYKCVQFVTMFCGTFDKTLDDPVSLFEILLCHTKGPARAAIESCVFSPPKVNRYEEATSILKH